MDSKRGRKEKTKCVRAMVLEENDENTMDCKENKCMGAETSKRRSSPGQSSATTQIILFRSCDEGEWAREGHDDRDGEWQRNRDRPKARWLDEVKEATGKSLQELKELVRDRKGWRAQIKSVSRGRQATQGNK